MPIDSTLAMCSLLQHNQKHKVKIISRTEAPFLIDEHPSDKALQTAQTTIEYWALFGKSAILLVYYIIIGMLDDTEILTALSCLYWQKHSWKIAKLSQYQTVSMVHGTGMQFIRSGPYWIGSIPTKRKWPQPKLISGLGIKVPL